MSLRRGYVAFAMVLLPRLTSAQQLEVYKFRGITGLTEDTRIELSRLGQPSWHTVSSPGQTLRAVLRTVCGSQGARADAYLEAATLQFNGGDNLDRLIAPGVAVAVPFCIKVESGVPVMVSAGDTVEKLLREHYGVYGKKTVKQTFELNNAEGRWASIKQFTHHLKPGQKILLPTSDERVFVRRRHGFLAWTSEPLPNVLERLASAPAAEAMRTTMAALDPELTRDEREYEYVKFVRSAAASGQANCGPGTARPAFSVQMLKNRLAVEGKAAAFSSSARSALIGVIDTGIGGLGGSFFSTKFFEPNELEKYGQMERDDDSPRNGFIDDIYGMNLNAGNQNGSVAFYGADPERQHGTKIASLLLGGPGWVNSLDADAEPRIRLKVVNFSDARLPHPVPAVELSRAIVYLIDQGSDIVNMSLSNAQELEPVTVAMKGSRTTVFVVAAGNKEQSEGQDLGSTGVYPAAQGGRAGGLSDRLITVGAHDNDGDWARFSNFSSEYVDLLAPGCSIPTIDLDGNEVAEYGTSVATAVVSFAAGLVRSLGEKHPHALKNRLLISVDVDKRLEGKASTSGRLNIIKAVSLRHDLIEPLTQQAGYLFGRLADRDELRKFCDEPSKRLKLEDLRKVRPNVSKNGKRFIEYWGERNDGKLWRTECPQIRSDESIGALLVDGVETPGPLLRDIRDIVLATKPLVGGAQ